MLEIPREILPLSLPTARHPHCPTFILFIFFYLTDTQSCGGHDQKLVPRVHSQSTKTHEDRCARPRTDRLCRPNTQNCRELMSEQTPKTPSVILGISGLE